MPLINLGRTWTLNWWWWWWWSIQGGRPQDWTHTHTLYAIVSTVKYLGFMKPRILTLCLDNRVYRWHFSEEVLRVMIWFAAKLSLGSRCSAKCSNLNFQIRFFVSSSAQLVQFFNLIFIIIILCHCGLVESACTWDGTGCKFESWQCRIYIIFHVHRAYDYLGPVGVLWVHMA